MLQRRGQRPPYAARPSRPSVRPSSVGRTLTSEEGGTTLKPWRTYEPSTGAATRLAGRHRPAVSTGATGPNVCPAPMPHLPIFHSASFDPRLTLPVLWLAQSAPGRLSDLPGRSQNCYDFPYIESSTGLRPVSCGRAPFGRPSSAPLGARCLPLYNRVTKTPLPEHPRTRGTTWT